MTNSKIKTSIRQS